MGELTAQWWGQRGEIQPILWSRIEIFHKPGKYNWVRRKKQFSCVGFLWDKWRCLEEVLWVLFGWNKFMQLEQEGVELQQLLLVQNCLLINLYPVSCFNSKCSSSLSPTTAGIYILDDWLYKNARIACYSLDYTITIHYGRGVLYSWL